MEPWNNLPGKVVLVTGASSGLGRELCLDLAKAGCLIIAAARRVDRLNSLCDEINQTNELPSTKTVVFVELDVTSKENKIVEAVQKALDAFGRIDVLINNAGYRGSISSVIDISQEEWDRTMKTNLDGQWLVAKSVMAHMIKTRIAGSIINISSTAGLNRVLAPGSVSYVNSKSALHALTKVMSLEMGRYGIRVNAIAPGIFQSEITEELFKKKWLTNIERKGVPLKKFVQANPGLTSLIRYLIHDSSYYISGNVFIVDSGYSLPGFPLFSSL
ncbi:3-oxoacyl-[acyl-carrier-protein] reductase FabG-like [Impatiens glandulifera]|uniref:3-oxoacyl-[acyl-carrier-protein] reductase FabG-like n=1 Tax=Impatiens glandulifera TaxID=253017 RepID=UPI001FB085C1|nr:3-oxoacyl-[acyl-carrier-protein] reductase FabG-like [Impatiens glandulifera]